MENDSRNPYAPPAAPVDGGEPGPIGPNGSLEDAVAGRYDFTISEVLSEAWDLVKGFKGPFWGALLIIYVIIIAIGAVAGVGFLARDTADPPSQLWLQGLNLLLGVIMAPLFVGLITLAIRRASGLPVSFTMAFRPLRKAPVLVAAAVVVALMTYAGLFLLVLPGIYLGLAYGMTLPLLAFNELGIWQAMETSRKSITHHWFRLFGLYLVVGVLVSISALPLGIPLIWTLPWAMLVIGVVYRRMFGIPSADAAAS